MRMRIIAALCLSPMFLFAQTQEPDLTAREAAVAHWRANAAKYGIRDVAQELRERSGRRDELGINHIRYDQYYQGVKVFEGEAIAHIAANGEVTVTNALRPNLNLSVVPAVRPAEAVATVVRQLGIQGQHQRQVALEILPQGARSARDLLVWHVKLFVENDVDKTGQWDAFVDARNGAVVWMFDSLETSASVGTGKTMYSGDVSVGTDFTSSTYYLRDLTRSGNYTTDMNNRQIGSGTTFTRSNNIFGNNKLDNSDRATAGADAHFGMMMTWDYFKNVHGRNGIDGAGKKTYSRVHYARNYENAFWSDSCFCMTYGDGATTFYPLVSLDVAGHEMAHGVMSREAALTYSGESGGLNESSSDIFGTMVEYYASAFHTPDVPDFWIGERIYRSNWSNGTFTQLKALRYMDDPHKDGVSPACWSSNLGSLDVHYSSGPNNHMFYLLSQGGTSMCNGNVVNGIGMEDARKIWYKAIADYMVSSTNYAGARQACLNAAAALFGTNSMQYKGVDAAYAAINVK